MGRMPLVIASMSSWETTLAKHRASAWASSFILTSSSAGTATSSWRCNITLLICDIFWLYWRRFCLRLFSVHNARKKKKKKMCQKIFDSIYRLCRGERSVDSVCSGAHVLTNIIDLPVLWHRHVQATTEQLPGSNKQNLDTTVLRHGSVLPSFKTPRQS